MKRRDGIARWVITLGGVIVIASVLAILLLIVSVALPLFGGARAELAADTELPGGIAGDDVLAVGVDRVELGEGGSEDSLSAFVLSRHGKCVALDLSQASPGREPGDALRSGPPPSPGLRPGLAEPSPGLALLGEVQIDPPGEAAGQTIVAAERFGDGKYTLLWSDGAVSLVQVLLTPQFDSAGERSVAFFVPTRADLPPEEGVVPRRAAMRQVTRQEAGKDVVYMTCVKLLPGNRIAVQKDITREGMIDTETETHRTVLAERIPGPITALALDGEGKMLYAGTANGCLLQWELDDRGNVVFSEVINAFADRRTITCLALMQGEVSLAVGDAQGEVSTWFEIRKEDSRKLRLIHRLSQHGGPVRALFPSGRDKSVLSLGDDGEAALDHMTSERQLLRLAGKSPLRAAGYSPRGNALIGVDAAGRLAVWRIQGRLLFWNTASPHFDVSWSTLFGKVHYEGYAEPEYKWQTTGDEPKFSLVPIVFGTLKCTFYAMLFALPLALFGAVYVSHFTTPAFKRAIKPVVEIMAAVPSVVIGFLILLWLAPLVGRWLVAVFASLLTIPAAFVLFMALWQKLRRFDWAKRVESGYEFLVLVPVVVAGAVAAVLLSAPLERAIFGGDVRQWIFDALRSPYDQLNTLVVAVGLGFAVIPIIFSISEDALSSIPHSLTAASLALGASRWQTVWRVVLPSASPGIFAAAMIGFGRAVGETMIVFMATGNTPLLDPNPFNGFRSLSANIAVEMPEAAVGGTLFRVLFLCGVLLFILTFCLNTGAELVRQHLRKRYGRY